MYTIIIIILYILNIFLNRYLNKIAYKHSGATKAWQIWFIPILPTLVLFFGIISEKINFDNWFTGKYW